MELIELIHKIVDGRIGNIMSISAQLAIVKSVDFDKCSCTVLIGDILLSDVNLRSVIDESKKGFVVFPKVDSFVLIGTIKNIETNAFVVMCSEITDVWIDAKVVFNNGDNKGMVKLPELVNKINILESKVNDIIAWTATHTHTGVTTGGGTSGVAVGVIGNLVETQESDLENKDIKQ